MIKIKTLGTYQGRILEKALGERGLEELTEKYQKFSLRTGVGIPPTSEEIEIVREYAKGGISVKNIAAKYDLTANQAQGLIRKVAVHQLRESV